MQLFCNFSFILFFQKGRAFARISLFERSERDLLFFSLLSFSFLCRISVTETPVSDTLTAFSTMLMQLNSSEMGFLHRFTTKMYLS